MSDNFYLETHMGCAGSLTNTLLTRLNEIVQFSDSLNSFRNFDHFSFNTMPYTIYIIVIT